MTAERRVCSHPDCDAPLRLSNDRPDGRCYRHRTDRRDSQERYLANLEYQREYRRRNAERIRIQERERSARKEAKRVEEYEMRLVAQGGGCAICGGLCKTGRRLARDHNHQTGAQRDLLCSGCNTGLGNFQDNPTILRAAADYLERHGMMKP